MRFEVFFGGSGTLGWRGGRGRGGQGSKVGVFVLLLKRVRGLRGRGGGLYMVREFIEMRGKVLDEGRFVQVQFCL